MIKKLLHAEILNERLTPEQAVNAVRNPVSLVLVNIRSLYNVGSIFRTSDATLIEELILCGYTPKPPRAEIEKTALGADKTVPWKYFKYPGEAVDYLKSKNSKVFALEITDRKRDYKSIKPDEFPAGFLLGNELTGLDNDLLNICDDALEIPMYGVKHSLNVSVAAGIITFEAVGIWKNRLVPDPII